MATAYSSNLRLALPVQGELSGQWGDTINDEITSLVEEAIAGRVVINTWTSDSHTLTTLNGAGDEARAMLLKLTDTGVALTGAGEVICPAVSKVYFVENDTGQTITVKTAAGTGYAIPTAEQKIVYCDGTNVQLATIVNASEVSYNNATSGLTATDVQAAIDEVDGNADTNAAGLAAHIADPTDAHDGSAISYNNATSGLTATDVQAAIDEVATDGSTTSADLAAHIADPTDAHDGSAISYNNATSGLAATDVQAAIDEVDGRLDTAETNVATNTGNIGTNTSAIAALQALDTVDFQTVDATGNITRQGTLTDVTKDNTASVVYTVVDAGYAAEDIIRFRKTRTLGSMDIITTGNQVAPNGAVDTTGGFASGTAGTVELKYDGSQWALRIY